MMGDGDSDEKRAANEAIFREANERIRDAEQDLDPPLERVPYICECDDAGCRATMPLTATEYEHVRGDGATFAIAPGHPSTGDVLEEHSQYLVVRKPENRGGETARALDPRGEDT